MSQYQSADLLPPQLWDIVEELQAVVGQRLSEEIDRSSALARTLDAADQRQIAAGMLAVEIDRRLDGPEGSLAGHPLVRKGVLDELFGMGRLQPLLDDSNITDLHIAGARNVFVKLRNGTKLTGPPIARTDDELLRIFQRWAARKGRAERRLDGVTPTLNLQLPDGSRMHAIIPPLSSRPHASIRRHNWDIASLDQIESGGSFGPQVTQFLRASVRAKMNVIVAGGTGTGKTTMLRALLNEIPAQERLITVEDSLEIGLERFADLHPNFECLESRDSNGEGEGEFDMAELVREGLRMDPDRVIVGEVRGAEVLPMLLAMSQGNDGSMCTVHAKSARGVFGRLSKYMTMTEERFDPEHSELFIADAVELVVHLGWIGGARRVTSIIHVTGFDHQILANDIFTLGRSGMVEFQPGSIAPVLADRLRPHVSGPTGWLPVPLVESIGSAS